MASKAALAAKTAQAAETTANTITELLRLVQELTTKVEMLQAAVERQSPPEVKAKK